MGWEAPVAATVGKIGLQGLMGAGIGLGGMSLLGDLFGSPSAPVPKTTETAKPPLESSEAVKSAKQSFYAKMIAEKSSPIGTNALGIPSDTLQTGRKTLLGGF